QIEELQHARLRWRRWRVGHRRVLSTHAVRLPRHEARRRLRDARLGGMNTERRLQLRLTAGQTGADDQRPGGLQEASAPELPLVELMFVTVLILLIAVVHGAS